MFWSKIGLGMVNIINNSDQTNLSEEELLELSKISSGKKFIYYEIHRAEFYF